MDTFIPSIWLIDLIEVAHQEWLKANEERRNQDANIALGITCGLLALAALTLR
jgi:hypothetical protein